MKKVPTIGKGTAALMLAAVLAAVGAPEIAYESLNGGGGISYGTNGVTMLGGTLGQNGFTGIGTGATARLQSGFWKRENGCELYPVAVSSFLLTATGSVAVTFNAVRSNVYMVVAISTEAGGPPAGTHAWTSLVAVLNGAGPPGSTTTITAFVSSLTNRAQFYRVVCADP